MYDKIFYSVVLFACSGLAGGLAIWGMKRYVSEATQNMKEAVIGVKGELKQTKEELKEHFNKTCSERRQYCQTHIGEILAELKVMNERQWEAIGKHGHKGLNGDDAKVTMGY